MTSLSGCPRPRSMERRYLEWHYDVRSVEYLPVPDERVDPGFFAVVDRRRSSREFGPLAQSDLATLLWYTAKTREREPSESSRWEHRPTPSAGGRHPIDLLVSNWPAGSETFYVYDPVGHALCAIHLPDSSARQRLVEDAVEVIGGRDGVILWHAAQFARTTSKYEHGETLVWRDAGGLVAVTALVSEALALACCPLGITGEPYLSTALGAGEAVVGVGGCVVGSRPK